MKKLVSEGSTHWIIKIHRKPIELKFALSNFLYINASMYYRNNMI